MKPRRSRSRDRERVKGECGEPAKTTTSVLAPVAARRARRFFLCDLWRRHMMNVPVPMKANMAAVTALFLDTQSCARSR